jgi:hypothetical protein
LPKNETQIKYPEPWESIELVGFLIRAIFAILATAEIFNTCMIELQLAEKGKLV